MDPIPELLGEPPVPDPGRLIRRHARLPMSVLLVLGEVAFERAAIHAEGLLVDQALPSTHVRS